MSNCCLLTFYLQSFSTYILTSLILMNDSDFLLQNILLNVIILHFFCHLQCWCLKESVTRIRHYLWKVRLNEADRFIIKNPPEILNLFFPITPADCTRDKKNENNERLNKTWRWGSPSKQWKKLWKIIFFHRNDPNLEGIKLLAQLNITSLYK